MIQFNLDVLVSEYSYSELVNTKVRLKKILEYSKLMIDDAIDNDNNQEVLRITEDMNNVFNNIRLVDEAMSVKTIVTFENISFN